MYDESVWMMLMMMLVLPLVTAELLMELLLSRSSRESVGWGGR